MKIEKGMLLHAEKKKKLTSLLPLVARGTLKEAYFFFSSLTLKAHFSTTHLAALFIFDEKSPLNLKLF